MLQEVFSIILKNKKTIESICRRHPVSGCLVVSELPKPLLSPIAVFWKTSDNRKA